MKLLALALFSTLSLSHAATDELQKLCYDTVDGTEFCTTDNLGKVQVFIYNAGWCPPCNAEVSELSAQFKQFEGKKVTFASLSGEGFNKGSKPDKVFLEKWKAKHSIPFVVAGKHRDFGKSFGSTGYIPFTVIVDANGTVTQKGNLEAIEILGAVKKLLGESEEAINVKEFFKNIRGLYTVLTVDGKPPHVEPGQDPQPAGVLFDEDFPEEENVSMPYCTETGCLNSGNYFIYTNTTVTKTEKGYHLVLKQDAKDLHYDWENAEEGKVLFRNHQFEITPGNFVKFEHVLIKK